MLNVLSDLSPCRFDLQRDWRNWSYCKTETILDLKFTGMILQIFNPFKGSKNWTHFWSSGESSITTFEEWMQSISVYTVLTSLQLKLNEGDPPLLMSWSCYWVLQLQQACALSKLHSLFKEYGLAAYEAIFPTLTTSIENFSAQNQVKINFCHIRASTVVYLEFNSY